MTIKILGTGCPKCKTLEANARKAVEMSGKEINVEKVDKIQDIMDYGVMATPALVVDEVVKSSGKVISAEEIMKLL